jgi:hypothetical protein
MAVWGVDFITAHDHEIRLNLARLADYGCTSAPANVCHFRVSEKGNCPVHIASISNTETLGIRAKLKLKFRVVGFSLCLCGSPH